MKLLMRYLRASAFLLLIGAVGCESSEIKGEHVVQIEGVSEPSIGGIPAPEFSVRTASGEVRTLEGYQGKPLLLVFWATWCGNCMRELPALAYFRSQIGSDKLSMLAVNVGESQGRISDFLSRVKLPYEVGIDREQKISDKFGVTAIPLMVLIDSTGNMVSRDYGLTPAMRSMIRIMVGEQ